MDTSRSGRGSHQCAFVFGEGCGPCAARRPWHTARPRGLRSGMGCQPAACLRPPAQAATVRTSIQRNGKRRKAKLLASVHFATCCMPRHVSSQMQMRGAMSYCLEDSGHHQPELDGVRAVTVVRHIRPFVDRTSPPCTCAAIASDVSFGYGFYHRQGYRRDQLSTGLIPSALGSSRDGL